MEFPPPYTVRHSARARRVGLRMTPLRGLEVVLPKGVDPACVPAVILRHKAWIERAFSRMGGVAGEQAGMRMPRSFLIKGGEERIILKDGSGRDLVFQGSGEPVAAGAEARASGRERVILLPSVVTRPGARPGVGLSWLRAWVRAEAGEYLFPWVERLAEQHGFTYSKITIRVQKSRWGSCSVKRALNLNACLLFLPENLTHYILLHELCHTREMNHGEAFWRLVFAVLPNALELDKAMRRAWRHVPAWMMA